MTDLILFAVLIIWLIYLRVRNALDNTSQKYFSDRAGSKTAVIKGRSYNGGG